MKIYYDKWGRIEKIETDSFTYSQYVKSGNWVPLSGVKFHKAPGFGITTCNVRIKGRGEDNLSKVTVIISGYFKPSFR